MDATILFLFLVQPFGLALAVDHWLGPRRPSGLPAVVAWMAAAVLACLLIGTPVAWVADRLAGGELALSLVVALSVCILTFAFLTGVWMARVGGGLLSTLKR
jgi:hypothetical protein